jgi:hypothetical protein
LRQPPDCRLQGSVFRRLHQISQKSRTRGLVRRLVKQGRKEEAKQNAPNGEFWYGGYSEERICEEIVGT